MNMKKSPFDLFEAFVEDGNYSQMKQHERFLDQAKSYLKTELHSLPGKRHEFQEVRMVAKFVAREIRKVNHEGLIEDLFDYIKPELVLPLITLKEKAMKEADVFGMASSYLLPDTYYVRPYLNKNGKKHVNVTDYLFGGQTVEQLVAEIKEVAACYKEITSHYKEIRQKLLDCPELRKKKKIPTTVGSLSLIRNKSTWNMNHVYESLGEEFITSFGEVKLSELDEKVVGGMIPKSIVNRHREIEDIRLDFVVMSMDDEERIMNTFRQRQTQLSLRKFA